MRYQSIIDQIQKSFLMLSEAYYLWYLGIDIDGDFLVSDETFIQTYFLYYSLSKGDCVEIDIDNPYNSDGPAYSLFRPWNTLSNSNPSACKVSKASNYAYRITAQTSTRSLKCYDSEWINPYSAIHLSRFDTFRLKIYTGCNLNNVKYSYSGVFDTANLYFVPRLLEPASITSSSTQIGDTNATFTVDFEPYYLLEHGYIYLTFPHWYMKNDGTPAAQKMITINNPDDCYTESTNFVITKCQLIGQQVQITFKNYTSGKIQFMINGRNPIRTMVKSGFYIETFDNLRYKMAKSNNLALQTKIDGSASIGIINFSYKEIYIGGCTSLKIYFQIPIPVQIGCFIMIKFPHTFKIDKTLITKLIVSGFFNNDCSVNLSMSYVSWVGNVMFIQACLHPNYIQPSTNDGGPSGSIEIDKINFPYCIKEDMVIEIKVYQDSNYEELLCEGELPLPITNLENGVVTLSKFTGKTDNDIKPNLESTYILKFTPQTKLFNNAKIKIKAPEKLLLTPICSCKSHTSTTLLNPTCTVVEDGWELTNIWATTVDDSAVYPGGKELTFEISSAINPGVLVKAGSWAVYTYYFDVESQLYYPVDSGQAPESFQVRETFIIPKSIASQSMMASEQSIYTFVFDIELDIPANGYIDIVYPDQIKITEEGLPMHFCEFKQRNVELEETICEVKDNNVVRVLISKELTFQNSPVTMTIGQFKNPPTLQPTDPFQLISYDNQGKLIESGTGFILTMTELPQINYVEVIPDSDVNSQITHYDIIVQVTIIEINIDYIIQIGFPSELDLSTVYEATLICGGTSYEIEYEIVVDQFTGDKICQFKLSNFNQNETLTCGGEYKIRINEIENYKSTKILYFSYIQIIDDEGYQCGNYNQIVYIDNESPAPISEANLTQSNLTYGEEAIYEVTFTPSSEVDEENYVVVIECPTDLIVIGCSFPANYSYNCTYNEDDNTLTYTGFNFTNGSYQGDIIVQFEAVNPTDNKGRGKITIKTYEEISDILYPIDELQDSSSELEPEAQCIFPCQDCHEIGTQNCKTCWQDDALFSHLQIKEDGTYTCQSSCDSGYTKNGNPQNICEPCGITCDICLDQGKVGDKSLCEKCSKDFNFKRGDYECISSCSSSEYISEVVDGTPQCSLCSTSCKTCFGEMDNCTSCDLPTHLQEFQCVQDCSSNYYLDEVKNECIKCEPPCATCRDAVTTCTSCDGTNSLFYLFTENSTCLENCPKGYEPFSSVCTKIPDFYLTSDQPEYLRCEGITINIEDAFGFDEADKAQFQWDYKIEEDKIEGYVYSSNMNKFTLSMKELFMYAQDKQAIYISPTLTELLIEEITLTVNVFAVNENNLKVDRSIVIKIFGNKNYFNLVQPADVKFYAFDGYHYQPKMITHQCQDNSTLYGLDEEVGGRIECNLTHIKTRETRQLEGCKATVEDGLKNDEKYSISYIIYPHDKHKEISGSFEIVTELVFPQCTLNQGGTIEHNTTNDLLLEAKLINNDINQFYYKWTCFYNGSVCEDIQRQQTQNPIYTLPSGSLMPDSEYSFQLYVITSDTLMELSECRVNVKTLPQTQLCPYQPLTLVHSYENARNYLNQILFHKIVCKPQDPTISQAGLSYTWTVYEEGSSVNKLEEENALISAEGQLLKIQPSSLSTNSQYKIGCSVTGQNFCSSIVGTYNTIPSNTVIVNFSISPSTGYAYVDDFTFSVSKISTALLKCQFGFIDPTTFSLIKLNDNYDGLPFTTEAETFTSVLPSTSDVVEVYAKCVDQRGEEGIFVDKVSLQLKAISREVKFSLALISENNGTLTVSQIVIEGKKLEIYKKGVDNELLLNLDIVFSQSIANLDCEQLSYTEKQEITNLLETISEEYSQYFREDNELFEAAAQALINLATGQNLTSFENITSLDLKNYNGSSYSSLDEELFTSMIKTVENLLVDSENKNSSTMSSLIIVMQVLCNELSGSQVPDSETYTYSSYLFVLAQKKVTTKTNSSTDSSIVIPDSGSDSTTPTEGDSSSTIQIGLDNPTSTQTTPEPLGDGGFTLEGSGDGTTNTEVPIEPVDSGTSNDQTTVTIPTEQEVFTEYEYVVFKVFVQNTTMIVNQGDSAQQNFSSVITMIQAEGTSESISLGSEFLLETLKVLDLPEPITISFSLLDLSPDNEEFSKMCAFYNETTQKWEVIEDGTVRYVLYHKYYN